ncbi:MAG: Hsp70 family protein, partial [bacterium]|nr:Hsp70 family protein [bacterium]
AADNRSLGQFNLTDIPPAPRNMPKIEVTFAIDANGIMSVSAMDMGTGKQQSIEIKGTSGLNDAEVEKMKKDAEDHAEDDKKRRELVDLKNQGDAMAFQMEKMLTEQGEKVSPEDRSAIESGVRALREALAGDDREVINRAMQSLEQASHKMAEELYKTAGPDTPDAAPGGEQGPQGPDAGGDDVIDAEFEVKE